MTGAELLLGRLVMVVLRRSSGGIQPLAGAMTLAAVGAAGILLQTGGRYIFVGWADVAGLSASADGGTAEPAPTVEDLRGLWG